MPLSERHRSKVKTHHKVLDWDKSGYVTKKNFEQVAENFAKIRGEASGSPMHKNLLENFQLIWTTYWLPAAADKEKVSVDEFVRAIEGAVDAGVRKDEALLPMLFEVIDRDKSGTISITEHKQFFEAFKIDTAHSAAVFAAIDTNKDGIVSRPEFLEAGAKFFFFDEPDAPGNLFWGPIQ